MRRRIPLGWICIIGWLPVQMAMASGAVRPGEKKDASGTVLWMEHEGLRLTVGIKQNMLAGDELRLHPGLASTLPEQDLKLSTDGDFALEIQWTDWQAPGKDGNAENPVRLTKEQFMYDRHEFRTVSAAGELDLFFKGRPGIPLELKLTYQLDDGKFFCRRKLALRDLKNGRHFMQWIWPDCKVLQSAGPMVKAGGFGQPVALKLEQGGVFSGLEYPAGENRCEALAHRKTLVSCGQEMGCLIGSDWVESEWAVTGLTPDHRIHWWFEEYLDTVRVAPLRPYTLYNSWYDLRSPEYAKTPANVMNEASILNIIKLFKQNMVDRYGLKLDAFVLDDGWDVYRSDWELRKNEFPNGLKPLAEAARQELGATLGIWFGTTGGYSKRDWRISTMKDMGYETAGDQMCVAGRKYHELLRRRTTAMTAEMGVGYYKWDGIQFSCSEQDHGHPVGIYSRRAVLESVIDLCRAVREKNPATFLNITSGTWLSPWWVKYANQIWMQGEDYGWADVPSVSKRDAAITYRDSVLYDDFRQKDFWFPVQNLMTHGIIKGNLQALGREDEPLDEFTNDVLLYFARGVTMYEFYISPDLLKDGEWQAISRSALWARDRFPLLQRSRMIGGSPLKGETYGYSHFKGDRGILAVRNPVMEPGKIDVLLDPDQGLDSAAANLVLERVYPDRWISPKLYAAGARIELPLDGFELAVYELYPLESATRPLLAGAVFDDVVNGNTVSMKLFGGEGPIRLLNPEKVKSLKLDGRIISLRDLSAVPAQEPEEKVVSSLEPVGQGGGGFAVRFTVPPSAKGASLAVLLKPESGFQGRDLPVAGMVLDGKTAAAGQEAQEKSWCWYRLEVSPGSHQAEFKLDRSAAWRGQARVWLVTRSLRTARNLTVEMVASVPTAPLPPLPRPAGERRNAALLGETTVVVE